MPGTMKRKRSIFLRPLFFIPTILLVVLVAVAVFASRGGETYEFTEVRRGTMREEVSVTGKVKPAQEIELAFEKSGKIVRIAGAVGKKVSAGEILLELDTRELAAQLLEAQAQRDAEQAKLAELARGTRAEELAIAESKVRNAKVALETTKRSVIDTIGDAATKSDDTTRNKTDQMFTNPGGSATLSFTITNSALKSEIENQRVALEAMLREWLTSAPLLSITSDLRSALTSSKKNADAVKLFLERLTFALNGTTNLSQSTLDTYKSAVSSARGTITTVIASLTSAEEKYESAESELLLAENERALKIAGTAPEQLLAQQARLKEAKARVAAIEAQIDKNILRSPIKGTITDLDVSPGEIVAPNTPIVSVISESDLEIETNIPEIDIGKIAIGNTATITLDAYGDAVKFQGRIVSIDPATTVIEGVPTYKTKIHFEKSEKQAKPGMTANIEILSAERQGALIVPQRSVVFEGEKRFVYALTGNNGKEKREVTTGIRGSDGTIEILTGLSAGEKVLTAP